MQQFHKFITGWSFVGRGLADHDQQRSSRFSPTVKPEAPSAVLLLMGGETLETF
jgi:hypothetical protein